MAQIEPSGYADKTLFYTQVDKFRPAPAKFWG
jgi:hypothetical protein